MILDSKRNEKCAQKFFYFANPCKQNFYTYDNFTKKWSDRENEYES